MLGFACGVIGMSPFSFYTLTPAEFKDIAKAYTRAENAKMDMYALAVHSAIGMSLNGKRFKPIFSTDDREKVKKGSLGEREETLNYFKERKRR